MKKIAILISGSGSNAQAIIKACNSNIIAGKVIIVISNNPNAYGLIRAAKLGIDTKIINHNNFNSRSEYEDVLENFLISLKPDLIVLAGFMRVLGDKIINKFSNKMINLHPSLLPLYPGLNTHSKAIANNDSKHGISIHFVSSNLDAGPLIAQGVIQINNNEKIEKLIERIHKIEHLLLPEIVNELCAKNISLVGDNVKFNNIDVKENKFIIRNYEI